MGKMKIYITGSTGYIGSALFKYLIAQNNVEVIRLGRSEAVCDINFDMEKMEPIKFEKDSVVVHLAGVLPRSGAVLDDEHMSFNARSTRLLAESATMSGCKHFLYMSSAAVYKPSCNIIDESSCTKPQDSYGRSKVNAEFELQNIASDTNTKFTLVRPVSVYGFEGDEQSTISRIKNKLQKALFIFPGSGENIKSFVHLNDVVRAMYHLINSETSLKSRELNIFNLSVTRLCVKDVTIQLNSEFGKSRIVHISKRPILILIHIFAKFPFTKLISLKIENTLTKWTSSFNITGNRICENLDFCYLHGSSDSLDLIGSDIQITENSNPMTIERG